MYSYKKARTCFCICYDLYYGQATQIANKERGKAVIDGEDVTLATGDWLKISPAAKRQFFAASDSWITYVCIQVKENSLENFTTTDAV